MELLRKTLSHDSRYPGRDLNPVPPYQLVLKGFGPCGVIFMNVCVVITVSIVMLLREALLIGQSFQIFRHQIIFKLKFLDNFVKFE